MRQPCVLHEQAGDSLHVAIRVALCTSVLHPDIFPLSPYSRFAVRRRQSGSWHVPLSLSLFGLPPLAYKPDITHVVKVRGARQL